MAPFIKSTTKTLANYHFYELQTYPAQSLTSSGRQGKSIKNVTQQFKFELCPFDWLDQLASGTYDPTAVDLIKEIQIRVIVFTSDVYLPSGTALQDFWNIQDDYVLPIMNRVNRTKYTVIKDKVFRYANPNYFPDVNPVARSVMVNGQNKGYHFTIKRRWNSITFPTDASIVPADFKKCTYVAIIPNIQNVEKEKWCMIWHMVMTMYFTS